ncbi:pyridoxal phosphate phosphatase-like isoform X3 [Hibiscus syriacus]|uniref:Pyridoxal phosphate phosphatase-like isoform X3 n=1 Tax=Hibiscus syriacus TaxID=106335 RepID=A0A6A2Y3X2_HIBSY|nr:pyridoxal phosphate phosphatase-like isoform X3 [Hibiscus syriacus]
MMAKCSIAPSTEPLFQTFNGLQQLAETRRFNAWLLDQFGVLHDGKQPYPGAISTLEKLASTGAKMVIISNSSRRASTTIEKLKKLGFNPSLFVGAIASGELTHQYLQRRDNSWFAALGRSCIHTTWSDRGAISLEGLGLQVVENVEEADFILAHGTEALGLPSGLVLSISLEGPEKILECCATKKIPMVVANPDFVTVETRASSIMPVKICWFVLSTLAAKYENLGGEVKWMGKPDKIIYESAMAIVGVEASNSIAVGDSLHHDIKGANAAGIQSALSLEGSMQPNLDWIVLDKLQIHPLFRERGLLNGLKFSLQCKGMDICFKEALDSVSWEFILVVFGCNWVAERISGMDNAINVQSDSSTSSVSDPPASQGDPLSPYLYVLVMNVLAHMLDVAASRGIFRYHPKCEKIGLTHLCFADDLLIFSKGAADSNAGIQAVLGRFYEMLGPRLNPSKCDMFTAGVGANGLLDMQRISGFRPGVLPMRYLGVPLVTSKLTESDCQSFLNNISSRLEQWAKHRLSYKLTESDCQSLLNNISSRLEQWAKHRIEQLCSRFFWKSCDSAASGAKVRWQRVCMPKSKGGLGIKDLACWNKTCIFRLMKSLLADEGSLWVTWVKAYVIKERDFWTVEIKQSTTWNFRKIFSLRNEAFSILIAWLAILNKLATRDRLLKMGLSVCASWDRVVRSWDSEVEWAVATLEGKSMTVTIGISLT